MKPQPKYQFSAIGTNWSIETDTELSAGERELIDSMIAAFDLTYSRFRPDSLISHIASNAPGVFDFPASIVELYALYEKLESVTGGSVNPLVGKSLETLGYDADYSLTQKSDHAYIPPSFAATVHLRDNSLIVDKPVLIDIGAIGKGYLVDQIVKIISPNHDDYVIDASGDIAVHRSAVETIGLEDPRDASKVIGTVSISDKSLCASGINRRAWGDGLHHVIDARTGEPTKTDIVATWAIANSTVLADALATALFFTSPDRLQSHFGDFYYVVMNRDGSVTHNIDPIGKLYS